MSEFKNARALLFLQRVFYGIVSLGAVLCVLGFMAGFFFAGFAAHFPNVQLANICFPLSHPCAVAVGTRGEIVVASGFYGRIQYYDADGTFLHGFFYDGDGGAIRLRFNERGKLVALLSRLREIHTFTAAGLVLERKHTDLPTHDWPDPFHAQDKNGRVYLLRNTELSPRLDVEGPKNSVKTLLTNSWFVAPFAGPLAPWIGLSSTCVLSWAMSLLAHRKSQRVSGANGNAAFGARS